MGRSSSALTVFGIVAGLIFILAFAGCDKKSGDAIVLEKEHIAAQEISPTPGESQSATPAETSDTPTEPRPGEPERDLTHLNENEIVVDQYVMNRDVRGTSRDPRATNHEQWLVKVQMLNDGRKFDVHADQSQFEKLKDGDRIKVTYRIGKYTKTVWDADIQ
jgi:hypothetical protein